VERLSAISATIHKSVCQYVSGSELREAEEEKEKERGMREERLPTIWCFRREVMTREGRYMKIRRGRRR
jgi:hypothetical protein